MSTVRRWGPGPYTVAVIHGGPGAAGEMAAVARELAATGGILEPFQGATTLDGQVEELRAALGEHCTGPAVLIGFSWGAFLSWIVAARHPDLVRKVILVGSPPFEETYAGAVRKTRLQRLTPADRREAESLLATLGRQPQEDEGRALARLGEILARADTFASRGEDDGAVMLHYDAFQGVWAEAADLRRGNGLLRMGGSIRCPVVAIHGDYDPHPADGVNLPLSAVLPDFRFCLLNQCGHRPWTERHAAEEFFRILIREIQA